MHYALGLPERSSTHPRYTHTVLYSEVAVMGKAGLSQERLMEERIKDPNPHSL